VKHSIKCPSAIKVAQAILEGKCKHCQWASFKNTDDRKIPSNFCGAASNLIKKLEQWFEVCQKPFPCQLSEKERSCYLCLKLIALRQCLRNFECQPVFLDALKIVVKRGESIFQANGSMFVKFTIFDEFDKSSSLAKIEVPKIYPETPAQAKRRATAAGIIKNKFNNPVDKNITVRPAIKEIPRRSYLFSDDSDLVCKGCDRKVRTLYTKEQLCFRCIKLKKRNLIFSVALPSVQNDHLNTVFGKTTVGNLQRIGISTIAELLMAIKSNKGLLITKFGKKSVAQTINTLRNQGINI